MQEFLCTSLLQYQYMAYVLRHLSQLPRKNYLILGGLLNGKKKPEMISFFRSPIKDFVKLSIEGVE
jgi:hypothetical protein